ncbi:MAG: hypothetical protein DCF22_05720 [Leptolyngbya sp.]|nr:MAG: hypothetical protein DCF22_05720 [Leptolyngbya sp.]
MLFRQNTIDNCTSRTDKSAPAIALATEVLEIAQQFQQVPTVQGYAKTAIQVLQENGVEVGP